MNLEELYSGYYLCDGEIVSLNIILDYQFDSDHNPSAAFVELKIRKKLSRKKYEKRNVKLEFRQVEEIQIFEDFKSGSDYSDIVFIQLENGNYYLSLDPFGNSGIPNEDDNLVIIAKEVNIEEK